MRPAIFVGHGAPTLALDPGKGEPLRQWGRWLGRPAAVVVVSAHWTTRTPTLGATEAPPLIYDFAGFPEALYEVRYPAPGAPDLVERVRGCVPEIREEAGRGWDHGVWTPLVHLFPEANVPVLQMSLAVGAGPEGVFELGRRLAPLRGEGILLMGSGSLTHNLRALGPDGAAPDAFARDFDAWVADTLRTDGPEGLLAYRNAPSVRMSHPTEEHWLPLLFVAGAANPGEPVEFPVEGFEFSNLSRRCVQFGERGA